MSQPRVLFLLAIGLFLGAYPMLAATVAVGTCKPSLTSFTTISAAVSSVPPNSTVEVCPGTYSEQVMITQPLTLKGVSSGNEGQAVITVPGTGLAVTTTGLGYTIAALVVVTATGGPVNISDVTVDGAASNNVSYPTYLVGVLYDDGSSGTVNEITARNLNTVGSSPAGVGVFAENATATNESVTIENSSFHDNNNCAIITAGGSTLIATAKGNTVQAGGYGYQIQWFSAGSITANVVSGGYGGVDVYGPGTASGNTFANQTFGITAGNGAIVTSNKVSNASSAGIYDQGGGNTYKGNTITKVGVGIEFNCNTPTATGNTINDATTGLDSVPSSFSVGANNFNNVGTLRTDGCGFKPTPPKAHSGPMPAPAR
jgi:hypothetical protein